MDKIKDALETLMLNDIENINIDIIKHQYTVLSKIYHPDTSKIPKYKDGKKFVELSEAFNYASENIDLINEYLNKPQSRETKYSEFYDYFATKKDSSSGNTKNYSKEYTVRRNDQNTTNNNSSIYIAPLIISILMLLSILPMPYGYYTFLRIATFLIGIYILYYQYKQYQSITKEFIITLIAVIIWNPIVTVSFERELWSVLDIVGLILFGYLTFKFKSR